MSWYYADGGQQQGPIPDAEFETLIQSGRINANTLVWKEGMANWQPLSEIRPATGQGVPPRTEAPPTIGGTPGPGEIICVECGGRFPKTNAIQYGTTWVCATCKPIFVQRLKEGASIAPVGGVGALHYAGFWIRFAAKFIDGLIFMVILGIPIGLLAFRSVSTGGQGGMSSPSGLILQGVIQLGAIAFAVAYNTFFIGKFGATPGKMAVGLKVVSSEGLPITYLRAFGRAWAEQLSGLVCYIGYIIAGFDSEKRALHDHICSTRVIYK